MKEQTREGCLVRLACLPFCAVGSNPKSEPHLLAISPSPHSSNNDNAGSGGSEATSLGGNRDLEEAFVFLHVLRILPPSPGGLGEGINSGATSVDR